MPEKRTRLEVLADPARLALLRQLQARSESCSLEDLAAAADIHANTARGHLAALVAAKIAVREHAAGGGRGRPAVRYRLAEGWALPTTDLRDLAAILATIALREAHTDETRREVARDWGRHLAGPPGRRQDAGVLRRALERLGADASVAGRALRLSACPCPLVAPDQPRLICDLLIAAADGVLERCDAPLRVGEREHDPARRSCRVELRAPAR